jgi:pimeloyl-ACP methyl ester carboxylesterase
LSIVYPGLEYEVLKLNVSFGSFTLREDYFLYGPQRAKGVIVWSHGTFNPGGTWVDQRQSAAWAFITRFNLDGWDVLRFDRDPCFDTMPRALSQMATSIPQLHAAGYKRIVLAGQSRGAWQSLQVLQVPGVSS